MSLIHEKDLRQQPALTGLSTEQLGDWWLDSRTSAVLQAPSFVIAGEHNCLLNPAHPEFAPMKVEPPAIFHFDERLFERSLDGEIVSAPSAWAYLGASLG